jgi:hypothetical protein
MRSVSTKSMGLMSGAIIWPPTSSPGNWQAVLSVSDHSLPEDLIKTVLDARKLQAKPGP